MSIRGGEEATDVTSMEVKVDTAGCMAIPIDLKCNEHDRVASYSSLKKEGCWPCLKEKTFGRGKVQRHQSVDGRGYQSSSEMRIFTGFTSEVYAPLCQLTRL